MGFYQRLKDLREDADKKQSDVADALFMHIVQYGRYERGERELPFNIAINIAKYYNVSLDYIAGLSNKMGIQQDGITVQERKLIEEYRKLSEFEQGQVYERARTLAEKNSKK